MEDQIEESSTASSKYVLTIDDDCIIIEEEVIFDDRLGKTSIHSLKFNHNDQYIAAGIDSLIQVLEKEQLGSITS
jgi:hypothetical protein